MFKKAKRANLRRRNESDEDEHEQQQQQPPFGPPGVQEEIPFMETQSSAVSAGAATQNNGSNNNNGLFQSQSPVTFRAVKKDKKQGRGEAAANTAATVTQVGIAPKALLSFAEDEGSNCNRKLKSNY